MIWMKTKLKISLYFHRIANAGGAEKMITTLANNLEERGFDVYLITWDNVSDDSFYFLSRNVNWTKLGFNKGIVDKFRRYKALKNFLVKHAIDVVIGFVMSGDKVVYSAVKIAGAKLIVAERNAPSVYHLRYNALYRLQSYLLLHLADSITVQFQRFSHGYPASLKSRINFIPNPVQPTISRAKPDMPSLSGRYNLLCVSRMDNIQKRLDCLICSFYHIAEDFPDWDLILVGEGADKNELIGMASEYELSSRVLFRDTVGELSTIFLQANLFVIPSIWEGFPNALAEAMSFGLPAVGFAGADGVSDLIIDGETGWLAPLNGNVETLAKTLKSAMSDLDELRIRGQQGRMSIEAYEPNHVFKEWEKLISSVV